MHAWYGCPSSSSPLLTPHGVGGNQVNAKAFFRGPTPSTSKGFRRRGSSGRTVVVACRAPSSSSITDFDLYDLFGIDRSSDQSQIKSAYRALQKRCHPDIAGPAGHDMAIVLNEAYSLLSDPISRSAYDEEQAKMWEFRGYTGKPIYSTWLGPESEHRAVFVDEVRCVGCLKCALFASNTFAVESTYGRARVIKQWADPEYQILDAISACPVDCISFVERSDLAALEFLMSKQPRGNVRMTGGNVGVGARVANIFVEIEKFQKKFQEMEKASKTEGRECDLQGDMRVSAVQAIRSMVNWLRWGALTTAARPTSVEPQRPLLQLPTGGRDMNSQGPNLDKLREAAAKMREEGRAESARRNFHYSSDDEYWTPALILPSPLEGFNDSSMGNPKDTCDLEESVAKKLEFMPFIVEEEEPVSMRIPMVIGVASAIVVSSGGGHQLGVGLQEHFGGRMALEVVNSFELQVVLAGITWYLCGAAVVELVKVIRSRIDSRR